MNAEERALLRRLDRQFDAIRAMPPPIPARDRYRHGIEDVGPGAYIRVDAAHGPEIHRVESLSEYREKRWRWYELELLGLASGATVYVEWEKDDDVEISINGPELTLREVGVTADQVEAMSEAESGRIHFGGRSYHYDDDYAATYHRDASSGGQGQGRDKVEGAGGGEPVYFYDFETRDERHCLTVEEWGSAADGYEYVAFESETVGPDAVEVVALPAGS